MADFSLDMTVVHLPPLLDRMTGTAHQGGYGTLSYHWGLIAKRPGLRDDGSDRVGWWRITDWGWAFVKREATVPKYAKLYDGRCLGLDGVEIDIQDALGKRFEYDELMAGV